MIRHVLADGREVESVEGLVIPTTGATAAVYKIVADVVMNRLEATKQNKEEKSNAV